MNKKGDLRVLAYGRALYEYPEILLKEDQIVFITGIEDTFDGWWRGYISHEILDEDKGEGSLSLESDLNNLTSETDSDNKSDSDNEQKFPSNYVQVDGQESDTQILQLIEQICK